MSVIDLRWWYNDIYPYFSPLVEFLIVIPLNAASCRTGLSSYAIIKSKLTIRTLDQLTYISINISGFAMFEYYENAAQHFILVKAKKYRQATSKYETDCYLFVYFYIFEQTIYHNSK